MREYAIAPAVVNLPVLPPAAAHPWGLRRRLARCKRGNPWYSSGAHCARRDRMEGDLTGALRDARALAAALRRHAAAGVSPDALLAAAWELESATPESLGAERVPWPKRGGAPRRDPWYIPDVAMPRAAAFLRLVGWARGILSAIAARAYAALLWSRSTLLRALALDDAMPTTVPPHTHRPERESKALSLSGTSVATDKEWLKRYERYSRPEASATGT